MSNSFVSLEENGSIHAWDITNPAMCQRSPSGSIGPRSHKVHNRSHAKGLSDELGHMPFIFSIPRRVSKYSSKAVSMKRQSHPVPSYIRRLIEIYANVTECLSSRAHIQQRSFGHCLIQPGLNATRPAECLKIFRHFKSACDWVPQRPQGIKNKDVEGEQRELHEDSQDQSPHQDHGQSQKSADEDHGNTSSPDGLIW